MLYKYILLFHILGATVWTGGHLVLAVRFLPKALKDNNPKLINDFETEFEPIGITALAVQVVSGLWLAYHYMPKISLWFSFENTISTLIAVKLVLLALTVLLAAHARLRIIPQLEVENLRMLSAHIIGVTILSVMFVVIGVSFRTGGW